MHENGICDKIPLVGSVNRKSIDLEEYEKVRTRNRLQGVFLCCSSGN